jgi:methylenetetrahydrofolate dehydrogenase (NADP+)/methenyltetrahydrofolate cyclohydrolase
MARILDGKAEAARVRAEVAEAIAQRRQAGRRVPGLVTIRVGDDPASEVYVSHEVGRLSEAVELGADTTMPQLLEVIEQWNARADIDGILVQLPLPGDLDADVAVAAIDPAKDVDGLTPISQGRLFLGLPGLRPCTPKGCMRLLAATDVDPAGARAVVVGRSALVGKPIAMMLLEQNASVVMCHSRTRDLAAEVAAADILVVAVGRPGLVRGQWVKPGAVVLDVGINRVDGKLTGDVDYAAAAERAAWITPVPGGVGPMTVAMLLANTLEACQAREACS